MKNNILHRFAWNDLKTHQKDTLITVMTLTLIALACILLTVLTPIYGNKNIIEFQEKYGTFDYTAKRVYSKDELNHMMISLNGKKETLQASNVKKCYRQQLGSTFTGNSIEYIEGDASIITIRVRQGSLPSQNNEIAIQKSILDQYGYHDQLNSTIRIPYIAQDNQMCVGEWIITGILEEKSNASIITGLCDEDVKYSVYIDTQPSEQIDNIQELGLDSQINDEDFMTNHQLDTLIVMLQFVLFIIGCVILSGTTIASFENRKKDYTLLRGIGTTKHQLYYVVFLQSIILIIMSLTIAFIVSFLIITVLQMTVETIVPITFNIKYMMGVILIVTLITLISYFMPARGACYRALTGSFEGEEFQYFYYRYKKLHQMRPFYLGWRQLVNHKKQMIVKIFLIFISSLMMLNIIGSHLYQTSLKQQKQDQPQLQTDQKITLEYSVNEENVMDEKDFQVFQPYTTRIDYFHTFEYHSYSDYDAKIYCFGESVMNQFGVDQVNPGEVIVSQGFAKENTLNVVNVNSDIYKIQDQIDNFEESFLIMAEEDFQKYGDMEHYQEVIVEFESIEQKTQGMLAFASQGGQVKYNWRDRFNEAQKALHVQMEDNTETIPIFEWSLLLIAGFIYMYQLSYEILKQARTIGSYQLIGLRKWEIWSIYAYKSIIIASIGLVCALYYHFADMIIQYGNEGWHIFMGAMPMTIQVLPTILMILIFVFISLLPIYGILKKDGLENISMKD